MASSSRWRDGHAPAMHTTVVTTWTAIGCMDTHRESDICRGRVVGVIHAAASTGTDTCCTRCAAARTAQLPHRCRSHSFTNVTVVRTAEVKCWCTRRCHRKVAGPATTAVVHSVAHRTRRYDGRHGFNSPTGSVDTCQVSYAFEWWCLGRGPLSSRVFGATDSV